MRERASREPGSSEQGIPRIRRLGSSCRFSACRAPNITGDCGNFRVAGVARVTVTERSRAEIVAHSAILLWTRSGRWRGVEAKLVECPALSGADCGVSHYSARPATGNQKASFQVPSGT